MDHRPKQAGIREIAAKTGFSVKTVSRVLNNLASVRDSTRELILATARELSYYPDLHARSLRTRRGHSIGYIVPDITNAFYGTVGIAVERIFREEGYGLLMSFTGESGDQEEASLRQLLAQRVAGIVLASVGSTGPFICGSVLAARVPVVVIDNEVAGLRTNLVLHNNVAGAFALTAHLIQHGHRRIGCVTGPADETSGSERLQGYYDALTGGGVEPSTHLVKEGNWRLNGGYRATHELMAAGPERPTAIFFENSIMALGAYKALAELRLSVPNDVALVAYDNLEFVEALSPPLTTLDNPEERIGEIAAHILLDRIATGDIARVETHRVDGKLISRASCGC